MNQQARQDWSREIAFSDIPGLDRRRINGPLRPVGNDTCIALIGNPRGSYDDRCRPPENPAIRTLTETADFGPFRATGLRPAVAALHLIMADIGRAQPAIHDRLGSAGMMCCRLVRGSHSAISNHSWGLAIDLTIEGRLDPRGDERVQRGLLAIAPIFQRHGFYWGAAFRIEDSMHFEASDQLVRQWAAAGILGTATAAPRGALALGSRGPEVLALQQELNRALKIRIDEDGIFGRDTRSAVLGYQRLQGMRLTGNAGPALLGRLRDA